MQNKKSNANIVGAHDCACKPKQAGITLIALIITIIIMLILLAVTVNVALDGGLFNKTKEAAFKQEMASIKEEFDLFNMTKGAENIDYEQGTLNASKDLLIYNTKEGTEGDIYTVLSNSPEKHVKNFEIIKGELIYSSQNKKELKWAEEIGIKINPYLIVDGVLLSAETNLYLLDEATGTLVLPSTVTAIGEGAFGNVEGIKKIIIPSTVKEIKQDAFNGCTSLEEVIFETKIENGVEVGTEVIGNNAFSNCTNLISIELPNTVNTLGSTAFLRCSKLNNIVLSNNIKTINASTFYACTSLKSIIIPEGVTKIGNEVFHACTQLESINIPKSLTQISSSTFKGCENLKNINIDEENDNFAFSEGILFNNDKTQMIYILSSTIGSTQTTFTVPSTVTILDSGLLDSFTQIKKVVIPASVTNIQDWRFFTSSITEIEIDEDNPNYMESEGKVYNKDKTTLYLYYQNAKTITSIELEDNITTIGLYAFYLCSNLQSISIGKNVSNIGWDYVWNAHNAKLTTVKIDAENPYYISEGHGIYNKDKTTLVGVFGRVTEFNIPYGVETIGKRAFQYQNIRELSIPSTVTSINSNAFGGCESLEKIEIPNSMQAIDTTVFNGCTKLTQIIIDKEEGSIVGSPWYCPIRR